MQKKQFFSSALALVFGVGAAISLNACSDELSATSGKLNSNGDPAIGFSVTDAQQAMIDAHSRTGSTNPGTRAAAAVMNDIAPEALLQHTYRLHGAPTGDAVLHETTVPGVNPVDGEIKKPQPADMPHDAATRAAINNTIPDAFSSFGYRGTDNTGVNFSTTPNFLYNEKTTNTGSLVTPKYWAWADNHWGKFYAVYPYSDGSGATTVTGNGIAFSGNTYSGTPYLDFTVNSDPAKQVDLKVATSAGVEYATQGVAPNIPLNFRHALTAVKFGVGQNLSWNLNIVKIEITGVNSKGRYTHSTTAGQLGTWSAQSTPASFMYTLPTVVNTSKSVNAELTTDGTVFYMIPQTLGAGAKAVIYLQNPNNGAKTKITADLSGSTWTAGTTKMYTISNTNSNWEYKITATPEITGTWGDANIGTYSITSFRQQTGGSQQQAVAWEVIGFKKPGDSDFAMANKPAWISSLSKTEGNGGTYAETGQANIYNDPTEFKDKVKERWKSLQQADAGTLGTASAPYDLSTAGGSNPMSSANSYVVSKPGYYRIPIVYGNAITNGQTYTESYKPNIPAGTYHLQNFVDNLGNGIQHPWIEDQHNSGTDIVSKAALVWQDEQNLVSNVSVKNFSTTWTDESGVSQTQMRKYLVFRVRTDYIRGDNTAAATGTTGYHDGGNATIAVQTSDAPAKILWSYHIWVAPADVLNTTTVSTTTGYDYDLIAANLGWKYTKWNATVFSQPRSVLMRVRQKVGNGTSAAAYQYADVKITENPKNEREGYDTKYQWGRKDPFAGADAIVAGMSGAYSGSAGSGQPVSGSAANDLKGAISTPYQMGGSYYGQYYYNLWSGQNTLTDGQDDPAPVKTVYDPSPAGFVVPASNVFTAFSSGSASTQSTSINAIKGSWSFGWDFYNNDYTRDATLFFPASGCRDYSASPRHVGIFGYVGSGIPHNIFGWMNLFFESSNVAPLTYDARYVGFAVRPSAEH